jgi:hypothetical protein
MPDYDPTPDEHGLPKCSTDECRQYDGKRCGLLGFRPDIFCEPALKDQYDATKELAAFKDGVLKAVATTTEDPDGPGPGLGELIEKVIDGGESPGDELDLLRAYFVASERLLEKLGRMHHDALGVAAMKRHPIRPISAEIAAETLEEIAAQENTRDEMPELARDLKALAALLRATWVKEDES